MLNLSFEVEGVKELSRSIGQIEFQVSDWTDAFKIVDSYMHDVFANDVFSSEGAIVGLPWDELKERTLKEKARLGYPKDILIRTGKMKNAFQNNYGKDFAMMSNPTPYFKYHQSYTRGSRNLPRRAMLAFGNQQKASIAKIFYTFFHQKTHV